MTTSWNGARATRAWMLALAALCIVWVGRAQAQSAATIEAPGTGRTYTPSTFPRPHGSAGSSSGVREVQVLLQRASGSAWESWNGSEWSSTLAPQVADLNVATRVWAWPQSVALPSSTWVPRGSYRLQVVARAGNGSTLARAQSVFSVEAAPSRRAAPSNDAPENAIRISGATGRIAGTTVEAGANSVPGVWNGGFGDVFYRWTAPAGVSVAVFDGAGSQSNLYLRAFRYEANGAFTQAGGDNGDPNMTIAVTPGREYLILAGARFSAHGTFTLKWASGVPPRNDTKATATTISGLSGRAAGNNTAAKNHGFSGDDQGASFPDVWWKWQLPSGLSGRVKFDTAGSSFPASLTIWGVERSGNVSREGEGAGSVTFTARAGVQYFIEVYGTQGGRGTIALSWSVNGAPLPPTTGTVRGTVVNGQGQPMRAAVFLVTGPSLDPLLFAEAASLRRVDTAADGSYSFTNVEPGTYLVVSRVLNGVFDRAPRVTVTAGSTVRVTFRLALLDTGAPILTIDSITRREANGATVPATISGSVRDVNALPLLPPSGVQAVIYTIYRLRGDAANLRLPPGRRAVEAIYSQRAAAFVPNNGTGTFSRDTAGQAVSRGTTWIASLGPNVQAALASRPGTYRIAAAAIDNTFNNSLNPSNSTDPNKPAGSQLTYSHFAIRPARAVLSRTLPLAVTNNKVFTYAISVSNSGDLPLENVRVSQTINTGQTILQNTSITPAASEITATAVIWNLGRIAPHSTRLLRLQVQAAASNPFGSNVLAGALVVTSNARTRAFRRDQVNIESSIPFGNLLRSIGEALGSFFNPTFGTSLRDQRAQADLRTIRTNAGLTRLTGADAIRFGNRAMLVPLGGNNVLAIGPDTAVLGGTRIAADGNEVVAAGSASSVTIASTASDDILSDLVTNPQRVLTLTSALGGANVAALGGNNLISTGTEGIAAQGGGQFLDNANGLIAGTAMKLIGNDGSTLIGNDGSTLVDGLDGAGLVTDNGAGLKLAAGQGNSLIGLDGGTLIGLDGSTLIGNDGST